jgi:hypothetical protein
LPPHPATPGGQPLEPVATRDSTAPTPSKKDIKDAKEAARKAAKEAKEVKSRNDGSTVVAKLEALGMKSVFWAGKCEADKVSVGTFDVADGEGGMYGLVFDNTFSKTVSKTATFVLMTYPTSAPPTSGHHLHFSQATAAGSSTSLPRFSPALKPATSTDSLPHEMAGLRTVAADPRPKSMHGTEMKSFGGSTFYTGVMHKRRRNHNNYAKRFFSLDFTTGTLSYYQNRHSSALRGAIPLSLAVIGTDDRSREISVDSGAELWHLKVGNLKEFTGWKDALDRASRAINTEPPPRSASTTTATIAPADPAGDREWAAVEGLVGRVSGIRDAVRRLAKDTDPKYLPSSSLARSGISPSGTPSEASLDLSKDEDQPTEKRPFWKRKTGSSNTASTLFKRSVPTQYVPGSPSAAAVTNGYPHIPRRSHASELDIGLHERCMELLRDLDSAVSDFSLLIAESRQRRHPPATNTLKRESTAGSMSSDEFFDAHDGTHRSQILEIRRDSPDMAERVSVYDGDSDSSGEALHAEGFVRRLTFEEESSIFPSKPKSLSPLPLSPVNRRTIVAPPQQPPPSLISFLRKNVGKDLSTIAMPVAANEPTSLLQRVAEQLEYSELLDAAAQHADPTMRLLHIAAFAISSFSNNRVKERATRKPFNPMLGETFELVREDKGFRLVSEKISHRPVRMAMQAESRDWTFLQSPMPVQNFWGKSAELNTHGRGRVLLHPHAETYSYTLATSFLRNVIAGEKYVEPVSTMAVVNESSGAKAVVSFKAGGMFAGRSEEVSVAAFDARGAPLPLGAAGRWTSHLHLTEHGQDARAPALLWQAGPLSDGAAPRYGFTRFAAQLNEVTGVERGRLPPTDSRLRPDQRALEDGDMERAERLKARLEERQRARRREMEERGEEWAPRWFVVAGRDGDEDVWRLKTGTDGYWESRARGEWAGAADLFDS